jgi:hypothetical protein
LDNVYDKLNNADGNVNTDVREVCKKVYPQSKEHLRKGEEPEARERTRPSQISKTTKAKAKAKMQATEKTQIKKTRIAHLYFTVRRSFSRFLTYPKSLRKNFVIVVIRARALMSSLN